MKPSEHDLRDHPTDWWAGYRIGKKENLENVVFFFGIIIGFLIALPIWFWLGGT